MFCLPKTAWPPTSRIIPGDWGKVGSGWLARPLSSWTARFGGGGRIHQFLWQRSRAVSNANRNSAARSNEKLLRTGSSNSGWFRAWANRSYPEGNRLLLCISTGGRLWRFRVCGISQTKDAERRDKMSARTGKDTRSRQDP